MLKGFKNFLMRGDVVVVAIGLMIALAFSNLILAFTENIINPLIASAQGGQKPGLGAYVNGQVPSHFVNVGGFIQAIIYFIIFMAVLYFVIVVPYKMIMARRGQTVFGDPEPLKTCPACLSADLPSLATKCLHCGTDQPASAGA